MKDIPHQLVADILDEACFDGEAWTSGTCDRLAYRVLELERAGMTREAALDFVVDIVNTVKDEYGG